MNPIPVADIKPFPCIQPGGVTVVVNQGGAGDGTIDNAAVNAAIAENPEASKEALGLVIGTPIGELTATWDDGAAVFTGIGLHVENLASSPYSALLNLGEKDGETLTPFMRFLASNKLELYYGWTDETNYSRLQFYWTTGGFPDAMVIESQYAGAGTAKDLRLQAHGDKYINIGAGGVSINTLTRFGYHAKVATGLQLIFEDGGGDNVYIDSPANDTIRLRGGDAAGAAIHIPVITTPPSAPASGFILYSDTSGGKARVMAIFPNGAPQQLAIEP